MSEPIKIDPNIANEFNEGMKFGSGTQLPFQVAYFRFHNGEANLAALKTTNPTAYFGGWVTDRGPVDELAEQGIDMPAGFAGPVMMSDDTGKEYEAYTARSVLVAPIGYRISWYNKTTKERRPEKVGYFPGSRHHMQLVAYMGTRSQVGDQTVYNPWFPVVLTAYGWQVDRFQKAIAEWNKHTTTTRAVVAPGVPASFFFLAVGTFGKDRVQELVGKGQQSPITPIKAYLPDPMPEDLIRALFVGEEMVQIMSGLRRDAQEYLHAWDIALNEEAPTGKDGGRPRNNGPEEPDYDPPEETDEVPF